MLKNVKPTTCSCFRFERKALAEGWQQPASLPWDPSQTLLREANEMTGGRTGDNLGMKRCTQCGAGSEDSRFTMLNLCQVGHLGEGGDVTGTLVLTGLFPMQKSLVPSHVHVYIEDSSFLCLNTSDSHRA